MMKRYQHIIVCLVTLSLIFLSGMSWAQGIKERMRARRPAIQTMKTAGAVGENNAGFLEVRNPAGAQKAVVDAENADRRKVYDAIAKQQGTTAQVVGQRRAMQLNQIAKPGEWVQEANGSWHRK